MASLKRLPLLAIRFTVMIPRQRPVKRRKLAFVRISVERWRLVYGSQIPSRPPCNGLRSRTTKQMRCVTPVL